MIVANAEWATLLVAILVVMTLFARLARPQTSLVVSCHNVIWAGAILLIGTDLIQYKESSPQAWLTLASSLIFFNIGAFFSHSPHNAGIMAHNPGFNSAPNLPAQLTRRMLAALGAATMRGLTAQHPLEASFKGYLQGNGGNGRQIVKDRYIRQRVRANYASDLDELMRGAKQGERRRLTWNPGPPAAAPYVRRTARIWYQVE